MPELPEVETICRNLRALLTGLAVTGVEVREMRLRCPVSADFRSELRGRTILDVRRRGKYILISLEGERAWLIHLGMSGKVIFVKAEKTKEKHDHIIVTFDNGHELRYHDPRRFGLSIVVAQSDLSRLTQLESLGLEPLDERFNGDYLYAAACNSRRRIRDLLLDQTVTAGLGNIYVNEILFHAGVRPTRRAWRLSRMEVARIAEAAPKILRKAIRSRGTSFSDYRDGRDHRGKFQNHLRVYDREGEKCVACDATVKRIPIGNRSGFYCPKCQK